MCVADEAFPEAHAKYNLGPNGMYEGTSSNGLYLSVSQNGDDVKAYVSIAADNVEAIELHPSNQKYGLFRIELTAEAKKGPVWAYQQTAPFVCGSKNDILSVSCGWPSLFASRCCDKRNYMHEDGTGQTALRIGFKAAMLSSSTGIASPSPATSTPGR